MSYSVKPEKHELEKARKIVDSRLQGLVHTLDKDKDFTVGLGWSNSFTVEAKENEVLISIDTAEDDWEKDLERFLAQGFAQSFFEEKVEHSVFHWQNILELGMALHFAKDQTDFSPELDDKDELDPIKQELIDQLSLKLDEGDEILRYGYSLSYYVVEELLDQNEMEEIPKLQRSDVIEATEKVVE